MISQKLTLELQQILKDEFELDLSFKKVEQIGNFLLAYFETLLSMEKK